MLSDNPKTGDNSNVQINPKVATVDHHSDS